MSSQRSPAIDVSFSIRAAFAALRPNTTTLVALGVFLTSVAFYSTCLYPGVGGSINPGDSAKFQVLGHTPIMVHGPGYPLILMIAAAVRGMAIALPPWWTIAFAISVVPASIANAIAFLIARRLTERTLFALGITLVVGTAELMALQATEAEVYAINIAFVLGTLYLLMLFIEKRRVGFFVAACAVYALSFGNHLMMISMMPVFVALTWIYRDIILRPQVIAAVAFFVLLGASQYLYLAYVAHDPATSYSEYMPLPPTPLELIEYILVFYFGDLFGTGLESPRQLYQLGMTFWTAHRWVAVPIVAAGLPAFVLGWRRRDVAWWGIALVYGTALSFVPFMIWFGAGDIRAFHLPVLVPALIAAAASLGWSMTRWPDFKGAAASLLIAFGVVRAAETASALTARESQLDEVKPQIAELLSHPHPTRPYVALIYPMRMAALYYDLNGELPEPATYRLQWRVAYDLPVLSSIGGFVAGRDGNDFTRMIEHERPGMACASKKIPLRQDYRWPAFSFQCDLRDVAQPRRNRFDRRRT